jgi:hypothetical protein
VATKPTINQRVEKIIGFLLEGRKSLLGKSYSSSLLPCHGEKE